MTTAETAVREAAILFHAALVRAKDAGLVVAWPHSAEDLPAIAISDSGRVAPEMTTPSKAKRKA